jgi:hypothetical protein
VTARCRLKWNQCRRLGVLPSPLWGGVGVGVVVSAGDASANYDPHPARFARYPPNKGEGRTESAARFCIQPSTVGVEARCQAACWRTPSLSNCSDALNPPFTALGESTRAFAPNARQFVRLGFGDRFGAQAPVSAQAPGRAASFFRAVEGASMRALRRLGKQRTPPKRGWRGLHSAYSDHPGDGGVVGAAASP